MSAWHRAQLLHEKPRFSISFTLDVSVDVDNKAKLDSAVLFVS